MSLLKAARQYLRGLPQTRAIALEAPQDVVTVNLACHGRQIDVTRNNVIASLRPLTIAFGFDDSLRNVVRHERHPTLRFIDSVSRHFLAGLDLHHVDSWYAGGIELGLFEVSGFQQRCTSWLHRTWHMSRQDRGNRPKADLNNFAMSPAAIQQTMVFYTCPRPVVLAGVDDGDHRNLFSMDLIGPVAGDRYTLALPNTSRSLPAVKKARKLALSSVAASDHQIARQLDAHSRNVKIDWAELPFGMERSEVFSLPVPTTALKVTEVEVLDCCEIGSHCFFVTHIVAEKIRRHATQFHYTSGLHYCRRERSTRPFEPAF